MTKNFVADAALREFLRAGKESKKHLLHVASLCVSSADLCKSRESSYSFVLWPEVGSHLIGANFVYATKTALIKRMVVHFEKLKNCLKMA